MWHSQACILYTTALNTDPYSCPPEVKPRPMFIERLQGVWPKIIPVAMEMPIFYVNFSSLNYPNLNDESLEPYG